jgi:branched-chain amino acid transport system substrate-binding protein
MSLPKTVIGTLFAFAVVTALSACGSSASHSATTAASTPGGTTQQTPAPAGKAIVLGTICSCSGPQASVFGSIQKVSQAWASSVNASGGINGYPVKMITMDDGQNPAQSLQDAKALVEQDHVKAIVGETSLADQAWASYVAGKGIPVVGGSSTPSSFLTNADFFPSGTQLLVETAGALGLAKHANKQHIGVLYCAESPVCAQLNPLAKGLAALYGLKYFSGSIAATAPSYTAPCLAAKSAGVDSLFVADNTAVVQRVVTSCVQQAYRPLQTSLTQTESNAWLTDPNLQGALLAGTNANPFDTSSPAVLTFRAALNKYAPGFLSTPQFNYDTILPWIGGELFQAAAVAAKLTPSSTPADVKKGLYALKNETLGGLAPPLTFTPGKPAFIPCYFTQIVKGGKFVSLNNNQPTCLSATQLKALAAAAGAG